MSGAITGFVQFDTHDAARTVLETFRDQAIPGTGKKFKLDWAGFAETTFETDFDPNASQGDSLIINNLDPNVNDSILWSWLRGVTDQVLEANVVKDKLSLQQKGYAIAKFSNSSDAKKVIDQLDGTMLLNKAVSISKQSGGGFNEMGDLMQTAASAHTELAGGSDATTSAQQFYYHIPSPYLNNQPAMAAATPQTVVQPVYQQPTYQHPGYSQQYWTFDHATYEWVDPYGR